MRAAMEVWLWISMLCRLSSRPQQWPFIAVVSVEIAQAWVPLTETLFQVRPPVGYPVDCSWSLAPQQCMTCSLVTPQVTSSAALRSIFLASVFMKRSSSSKPRLLSRISLRCLMSTAAAMKIWKCSQAWRDQSASQSRRRSGYESSRLKKIRSHRKQKK